MTVLRIVANIAAERLEEADAFYAEAIDEPGAPPEAWRERGMSLRAAGNKPEALSALQHYLELAPNADDRAFVLSYIDELKTGS